ncbi:phospholipase D-like domain-containing protein [uncultured Flavobacterium sp.]|uniref:phospholipase D-like domain-containing protein n=1 Tax=uncultured Flavobacterium sp. TaxID=165435 RepID=UPI00292F9519|nr:phospholipase D-like domain-containing protein [uncultured Flavobacterium sp.]
MIAEPKVYIKGIEKKLIEYISSTEKSIYIAMAWFTNNDIKNSLINLKKKNPNIIIEIVVDDNYINDNYFSNTKSDFDSVGIKVKKNLTGIFLHNKFMIIDNQTTITGSYNYSKKANWNLENIIIVNSDNLSNYYFRLFQFITIENFKDENILLLFQHPKFAQSIISTYYNFTKIEYNAFKEKIEIGDCYTYDNGLGDSLFYLPGLIFNSKIKYNEDISSEFELPVNKEIIKKWIENENINLTLDFFRGKENLYHLITDELIENTRSLEIAFKRKIEKIIPADEIAKLIENEVNIIIEDDLWLMNFEPFINKKIIKEIFENLKPIEKKNYW